jgi:hypothetical protein
MAMMQQTQHFPALQHLHCPQEFGFGARGSQTLAQMQAQSKSTLTSVLAPQLEQQRHQPSSPLLLAQKLPLPLPLSLQQLPQQQAQAQQQVQTEPHGQAQQHVQAEQLPQTSSRQQQEQKRPQQPQQHHDLGALLGMLPWQACGGLLQLTQNDSGGQLQLPHHNSGGQLQLQRHGPSDGLLQFQGSDGLLQFQGMPIQLQMHGGLQQSFFQMPSMAALNAKQHMTPHQLPPPQQHMQHMQHRQLLMSQPQQVHFAQHK